MSRFLFVAALVCAAPAYAETRYFSELSDMPMPPGFEESDTAVGFDGAGGRLVMARAAGDLPSQEVRSFYAECLPALGWGLVPRADGVLMFQRGRERLTLTVHAENGRTLLGADLVVLPASMNAD